MNRPVQQRSYRSGSNYPPPENPKQELSGSAFWASLKTDVFRGSLLLFRQTKNGIEPPLFIVLPKIITVKPITRLTVLYEFCKQILRRLVAACRHFGVKLNAHQIFFARIFYRLDNTVRSPGRYCKILCDIL